MSKSTPSTRVRLFRAVIGAAILLPTMGVILYRLAAGEKLTLIEVSILMVIVFAAVIGVWGALALKRSVDAVEDLTDGYDDRE